MLLPLERMSWLVGVWVNDNPVTVVPKVGAGLSMISSLVSPSKLPLPQPNQVELALPRKDGANRPVPLLMTNCADAVCTPRTPATARQNIFFIELRSVDFR